MPTVWIQEGEYDYFLVKKKDASPMYDMEVELTDNQFRDIKEALRAYKQAQCLLKKKYWDGWYKNHPKISGIGRTAISGVIISISGTVVKRSGDIYQR